MQYSWTAIPPIDIPRADDPTFQHLLDTYVSETNKVASVWKEFRDADLAFKPHPRSSSVGEILRHQLLSERRFFGEFLGAPEPAPDQVLPASLTVDTALHRFVELARARLPFLPSARRPGGCNQHPSSTSSASASGFSGGASCTLRTIAPSSPWRCASSTATCLPPTGPRPMSPGPAPILPTPQRQREDADPFLFSAPAFFLKSKLALSLRARPSRCPLGCPYLPSGFPRHPKPASPSQPTTPSPPAIPTAKGDRDVRSCVLQHTLY